MAAAQLVFYLTHSTRCRRRENTFVVMKVDDTVPEFDKPE
jgi:hypothetical protein